MNKQVINCKLIFIILIAKISNTTKNLFLKNKRKLGRTASAINFSGQKNFSSFEYETEKQAQNLNMTKTNNLTNYFRRNKRYSAKTLKLNNNNNSNISLNSLNDFYNEKSSSTTNKYKTTKYRNRKLINFRPKSNETKINIDKINFFRKPDVPHNLDVLNLMLKHSPEKVDMKLVAQKMNILNKELKNKSVDSTDKKFYKYNIIFGYKSNNIIRSYTPKLIMKNYRINQEVSKNSSEIHQIFNEQDINALFYQKCKDLDIPLKEELLNRFSEYIKSKCINRKIDLTDCKLGFSSMVILSSILIKNKNNYSRLILSKNNFGDNGIELLLNSIGDNNNIVELNLSSNSITPKGGNLIFEYLLNQNSIVSLDLSSEDGLNKNRICSEGVKLIDKVLKTNFFLEFLDLSSNSIKTEGFRYLINGLNGNEIMKKLNVSNNEIDVKGIYYLKDNLKNSKVEYLDISQNPIGNEGCIAISQCLVVGQLSEIIYINLSDCLIKFNGAKEFLYNVKRNKKLDTILFNKNNLFSKKWIYLEKLLINLNLKHLGLNSCSLNTAINDIAKIFLHHPTLKILELSHNQINDEIFSIFKSFPKENLSVTELDFSRNYISDISAKSFFQNLNNNKNIQKLNFFDNHLQNESANAIIESLKNNDCLFYINLKANRIPIKVIIDINMKIQSNKLREKGNFLPKLRQEIKELAFEPNEVNMLKNRIIMQNKEKIFSSKKLKEDNKIIKLKKSENVKTLNLIESQSEDLLSKLEEINKEINNELELKDIEKSNFEQKRNFIEKKIINLFAEVDGINNDNEEMQKKYDDELKKMTKKYNTSLSKYEENRKLLDVLVGQLKYKQKKYKLCLRVLDKLKNPDKYVKTKEKNSNEESKNDLKNEVVKENIDNSKLNKVSSSKKIKK